MRATVVLSFIVLAVPRALVAQSGQRHGCGDQTADGLGHLPIAFIENRGQMDARVRFQARDGEMTAYFTDGAFVLQPARRKSVGAEPSMVETGRPSFAGAAGDAAITGANVFLSFEGASPGAAVEGIDPLPGRYNYLVGNDPAQWRTDVMSYASIRYRGLYPNIDVVVRDHEGCIEYDLILEPGADLDRVAMHCEGGERLRIDDEGSLVVGTAAGPIAQARPHTYRVSPAGERLPVDCWFRLRGESCFGFEVLDRQAHLPLVVDPGLVYSTALGRSSFDEIEDSALDSTGAVVTGGWTFASNFPTTPGAFDTTFNGFVDAFVTKFNPTAGALIYSTFLGGLDRDEVWALALDPAGNATVGGHSWSTNFPVTAGAYDTTFSGLTEGFVAKLGASGSSLVYSTFLGGSNADQVFDLALDASGAAVVAGVTGSGDFPTTGGAYRRVPASGFVTRFDTSGSALVSSTFFPSGCNALALDATEAPVVTGQTSSPSFPTTPGAYDTSYNGGSDDGFVAKLDASLGSLVYSTFLGGSSVDYCYAVVLDAGGGAVVTGTTASTDFPTTPGAYDTTNPGRYDSFVAKLDASGSTLVASTFLGGGGLTDEYGMALALDGDGAIVLAGFTNSTDFPTTIGAYDSTQNGAADVYVVELDPSLSTLLHSTFVGGSNNDFPDFAGGLTVDAAGAVVLTGHAESTNFPTTPGAYDTSFDGWDAFLLKLEFCATAAATEYGSGWPGTLGVPALTSSGPPILCSPIVLSIGNSSGVTTPAVFLIGFSSASIPTAFGGTLLVLPSFVVPFTLPGGGATVPYSVACSNALCGLALHLQVIQLDPGASRGVSFTPGLTLVHGE